ncbi:hypothetical protein V1520DRAFT_335568 [Lipomyces starkeyi]|uniref:Eisosome protein 1 n=1 Tax=Lipomyces starkeyi NRRL Y-11557 TaxID=675824 RepID=A0A1E3PV26_LIPST|nr:hypothetical protein LIPSTDRAFT_6937 [Lipomyces starkeyi NRRL Y-11557]
MLATGPSRSNATQTWVNSTSAPARRPSANRLPTTELTSDDQLRNSAASAAIVSTAPTTSTRTTTTSGRRVSEKNNVSHRVRSQGNASEEMRSGTVSSSKNLAAASAKASLRSQPSRYANPVDLPSHPIVGVDMSSSNKAALLAGNVQVKSMWKPTGTSSTAASAAMLAHSSPKSPELWKPDPSSREGLAAILSKDPKYTITSQTGSGGAKTQMPSASSRPSRLSVAAGQKHYSPNHVHQAGRHTPPLSPKMEAAGAGKHAMANVPSSIPTSQSQERYSLSASAARNAPPTPPSPVEVDDSELSRGAAGAALYGKQPRQSYVEPTSTVSTQIGSLAALEVAAKRAAATRLSKIGEPQPAYHVLSPSTHERTQRPVTALSGAEYASRRVQIEHQRQVDRERKMRETDKYDTVTRYEMLLAAAQRNVHSKLDAMDKEAASNYLFGNKEFNAMALALAEQDIKGKYTAKHAKVFDMGGGVFMSPEEVQQIAEKHVKPVLAELNEKAFEQREKDELARHEKERMKVEKAEEKARKKEEKADQKTRKETEKQTRKEGKEEEKQRKETEKQTRKEGKEEEKQRKRDEKQRKKEEKEHEKELKALNKEEKKKQQKTSKRGAERTVGLTTQGAEISAAAAIPVAAGAATSTAGGPMPAIPTEYVKYTEKVAGNVGAEGPTAATAEPVYQAGKEPGVEGYETPIEECATTGATQMPESSFPASAFRTEGYETPVEECATAGVMKIPKSSFPDSVSHAEGHETPIEECTTTVDACAAAGVTAPEPAGLKSAIPESSFPAAAVGGTGADVQSSARAEDTVATHETEEPEAENDIETGYEYIRPEDVVDSTDEPNGVADASTP